MSGPVTSSRCRRNLLPGVDVDLALLGRELEHMQRTEAALERAELLAPQLLKRRPGAELAALGPLANEPSAWPLIASRVSNQAVHPSQEGWRSEGEQEEGGGQKMQMHEILSSQQLVSSHFAPTPFFFFQSPRLKLTRSSSSLSFCGEKSELVVVILLGQRPIWTPTWSLRQTFWWPGRATSATRRAVQYRTTVGSFWRAALLPE